MNDGKLTLYFKDRVMALTIVKKVNSATPKKNLSLVSSQREDKIMKKAIVTICGIIGGLYDKTNMIYTLDVKEANYLPQNDLPLKEGKYINMLPLLIDNKTDDFDLLALATKDAQLVQKMVLEHYEKDKSVVQFKSIDENKETEYDSYFGEIIHILEEYDEVILDVSHGFRHLPLLTIIALVIQHIGDTSKIKHIYFAQEIVLREEYKILDLVEYLEIANIAFILSTFQNNYTVANHIKSTKHKDLIQKLNAFSNDLMALSLNNLFKVSSKQLIKELDKVENIAIRSQAKRLSEAIIKLSDYEGKKCYQSNFALAKDLYEKNYMLLSLSLLYESIRAYVKSNIKKTHKEIVEKIEKGLNNDTYAIGDFFIKFKNENYTFAKAQSHWSDPKIKRFKKVELLPISEKEFNTIKESFPKLRDLIDKIASKRNDLSHGNASNKSLGDIKKDIKILIDAYEKQCIKEKSISDLQKFIQG